MEKLSENLDRKCLIAEDSEQTHPALPIELILEIISRLDEYEDIIICMTLSKEIRDSIFTSQKIMKRFKFQFSTAKKDEWMDFVAARGFGMRNVAVEIMPDFNGKIEDILTMFSNVEDLDLKLGEAAIEENENADVDAAKSAVDVAEEALTEFASKIQLKNLKTLKISTKFLKTFQKVSKISENLKNLTIYYDTPEDEATMYQFIYQQHNIEKLSILNQHTENFIFPSSNIAKNFQFKLKSFKLNIYHFIHENQDLVDFLKIHAATLEEIDFDFSLYQNTCDVIVEKMPKLTKLTHRSDISFPIYTQNFKKTSIKYLYDQNPTELSFENIASRFPSLEHLKCSSVKFESGIAGNLRTLELENLVLDYLKRFKFSKLKNLMVDDFTARSDDSIKYLVKAIPENIDLIIRDSRCENILESVLKNEDLINKVNSLCILAEPFDYESEIVLGIRPDEWFYIICYEKFEKVFHIRTIDYWKYAKIYHYMYHLKRKNYEVVFNRVDLESYREMYYNIDNFSKNNMYAQLCN